MIPTPAMTRLLTFVTSLVLMVASCAGPAPVIEAPPAPEPPLPPVQREFRAAWIATVANIDWPSRQGLSTGEQKMEMRRLLDRAVAVGLNGGIFQVRPCMVKPFPGSTPHSHDTGFREACKCRAPRIR